MARCGLLVASAVFLLECSAVVAQTTAGTSATIVIPVIAQTSSFASEVTLYNPNASAINVNAVFYDAQNTASPGLKACTTVSIGANVSKAFTVASQCALPSGSNFGFLVLSEATGTQRFYGYARTQTPQGIGFSTEGFPIENFNDQIQHATGLRRVAASGALPAYQTNCFVATLGDAVNYELRLFDGTSKVQLGGTLSGTLGAFQQLRYLDVFAMAGVPAGNKTNVRAQFTNLTGANKKLIGFCTVQENTNLSADFRIAKSYGGTPQNAFVQGGNAFATAALLGTNDNQPLTLLINNRPTLRLSAVIDAFSADTVNFINGSPLNTVDAGVIGGTIGGGGGTVLGAGLTTPVPNHLVTNPFGTTFATIGGGGGNTAGADGATIAGGFDNTASAPYSTVAGGANNTASNSGSAVLGGESNVAPGDFATVAGGFDNAASGSYSTVVGGAHNLASFTGGVAMGQGANANYDGCLVFGDNSTSNEVRCDDHNRVVFRGLGGIFMFSGGSSQATYTGVVLPPGAQAWIAASDRAGKENIAPVDAQEVLAKVRAMPITTWNWKTQHSAIRHMGPMAQDFRAAFSLGETDKGISTIDADGVALAAIQGLHQLVQERDARIEAQQREIEDLRERMAKIESIRSELDAMKRALSQVVAAELRVLMQRP